MRPSDVILKYGQEAVPGERSEPPHPTPKQRGIPLEGKASPTKKFKLTELGQVRTKRHSQTWLFSAGPRSLSGRPSLWGKKGENLTANLSLWVRRCWGQRVCRASLSFPCTLRFWKTAHLPFHQELAAPAETTGLDCRTSLFPIPGRRPSPGQRPFSLTGLPHPVFTCLCQSLRKGNVGLC